MKTIITYAGQKFEVTDAGAGTTQVLTNVPVVPQSVTFRGRTLPLPEQLLEIQFGVVLNCQCRDTESFCRECVDHFATAARAIHRMHREHKEAFASFEFTEHHVIVQLTSSRKLCRVFGGRCPRIVAVDVKDNKARQVATSSYLSVVMEAALNIFVQNLSLGTRN